MPQVVPFLIKVGTLVTFGAATGTAAAVIGGIAVVGVFTASKFLKPKLNMNLDDNATTRSATVRGTTEAQKRVYGETLVSGPITYAQVSGADNRHLHQVIALAGHELTDIRRIYLDDDYIDLKNSTIYNSTSKLVVSGKYGPQTNENGVSENVVLIDTRIGAASQTPYAELRSNNLTSQEYLDTHKGNGIASVYVRLTVHEGSAKLWDEVGNPRNIRALVHGAKVYDPRLEVDAGGTAGANPTNASYVVFDDDSLGVGTAVNEYARDEQGKNPALIAADILMNDDFGLGLPASKIDWDSVITAADKCDQLVPIPTSEVQKRFIGSGVVFGTDSHRRTLEKILMAMDGELLYSQGKYIIKAGVYEAPTETLTEDDIVSAVQVKTSTPRQDRFNEISGLFIDPDENYKMMEFGPITVDGAYARDNSEVLPEEIKLPFTQNRYVAQRIAWKKVNQSFAQTMISITVNLKGMRIRVGDRINLTLTDFESIDSGNWSPKIFKVVTWGFAEDGSGVDLTLIEDYASLYDDPDEDDYSTIDAQGTITTALPDVESPSSFSATSQINAIRLDWTNPPNSSSWEQIWIFRNTSGTTPTDSDTPITKLRADSFIDQRDADGTEYYYWIQAVKYPTGSTPSSGNTNKFKSQMVALSTPDSGKIAATKIGQTVMDSDSVGSAQVIDGEIGSDQIATTIQSNNWASSNGDDGWQINKDGSASFKTATIKGTITATDGEIGGTTIESDKLYQYSGSGSEAHGDADTDFYLDSSGNFSLKDKLVWTGGSTNTLEINGSGTFSGALSGGTISIGSGNAIFKADTNGIYLGNATFASAPFRVTPAGALTATNATITGSVTSTSGTIGGFTLASDKLSAGSTDATTVSLSTADGISLGHQTFASAPFRVSLAGDLTATNATITGTVTADTFTLNSGATLDDTDGQIENEAIDTDFPLGVTYYWPCNSVATVDANGDEELQEVIAGKTGIHSGSRAPTISTDSPSGRSIVNGTDNSGWTLLSDTDADALETANGFAWSLWFKSDTTSGDSQARIIGRDASDGWAVLIDQSATGNQAVTLYGEPSTESMGSLAQGEWHHFCLSEDGNGTITGYVNGEKVSTESYTPVDSARPVVIGCNTEAAINTAASVFEGKLTEIRAYNRALTAKEVRSLYKNPTAGTPAKIDGDLIVSNSITATEINVSNLSSLAADLGTVTAGQITISASSDPLETPSISGDDPSGKGILLKSDGDVFFGDATPSEEADKRYFFFDKSEGTVSVKGTLAPTTMDFSQVTDDTNVPANVKVNGYGDGSIGKAALSEEAYDEIARRVGNTGGFYATAAGFYLGSTKNIAIASTQDHGTQDVRVTVSINDVFTYPRNWAAGDNALKITVKLFAKKGTDSSYLSSHQIGTTQTFEATPTLLQYATRYTINESYQVVLASGTDIEDGTDYDFKVELTRVANPNAFKSSADGGANDTTGTPVTLEVAEGTISTAAAGNADTLDNLQATDFFRLGESGSTINNTAYGNQTFTGDVTITGALTITGNIDQYNVTDLDITDKTITVNSGGTQALSDGSGLIIDRGTAADASILWDETNDEFDFSNNINLGGKSLFNAQVVTGVDGSGWLEFNEDDNSVWPTDTDNLTVLGSVTHMVFAGDSNANGTGGIFYWGYGQGQNGGGTFTKTMDLDRSGNLTTTGSLRVHQGSPILELKDTTDDDDHHIYFKNNSGTVVYEIATQNATSGDALTLYSASQEIVHRIGTVNILEAHSGKVQANKPLIVQHGTADSSPATLRILSATEANTGQGDTYAQIELGVVGAENGSGNLTNGVTAAIKAIDTRSGETSYEDAGLAFLTTSSSDAAPVRRMIIGNSGGVHITDDGNIDDLGAGILRVDGQVQSSTGFYTSSTQRIDTSGNLPNAGNITFSSGGTITATDMDFAVRDTTDTVQNFIWRDHSEEKLYLGTANAEVELRSSLNLQNGHAIKINDTEVITSGREGSFATNALFNGVQSSNPTPSGDKLYVSGYGIIGNRSASVYVTNSNSAGTVQLGVGGAHNANPKLIVSNTSVRSNVDITMAGTTVIDDDRIHYALTTASNSVPRYTFSGDTDTGLGYIGTNQVGLIAGGSRKFYVSATNAYFQNLTGGVSLPKTIIAHSESSGMKLTATDSTANASFYGFHIDYNASGSDACTADRVHAGLFIDADSSATGGLTNHEHRFYGAYVDARVSGDSDNVRGGYFQARADDFGSGNQVTVMRGVEGYSIAHQNAGIVSAHMGVYGFGQDSSSGSGDTVTTYGGYFNAYASSTSTDSNNAYIGVRSFAQVSAGQTADIASLTAVWGEVQLDNDTAADHNVTISNAYVIRAEYDENDSDNSYTVNNGYLFYGNYEGALPTTAWGVYIADAVENYFAGSIRAYQGYKVGSTQVIDSSRNIYNAETLNVNHSSALSGTQVYIKRKDGSTNLQRWGEGTSGQSTYRFRIDQNFNFIANSGSGDNFTLHSATGNISGVGTIASGTVAITDAGSTTPTLDLNRSKDGGRIRFRYNGSTTTFGEIGMVHNGSTGDGRLWMGMNLNSFSSSHLGPTQGNSGHSSWYQEYSSEDDYIRFLRISAGGSSGTEKMKIGSSGVDIANTLSVAGDVAVGGSSDAARYITLNKAASGENGILFKNAGSNKIKILQDSSEHLRIYTNNTGLRMSILEGGSVLIGKSAEGTSNNGVELRQSGYIFGTTNGTVVARFNRRTSSGDVVEIRKDNSNVGTIGIEGGDSLYIQAGTSSGSGLRFHPTSGVISPVRNGAVSSGTISLGTTTQQFKDFHLAGDQYMAVGKKLYFGGGSHTYISEDIDDRMRIFVGGAEFIRLTESASDEVNIMKPTTLSSGTFSVLGGNINIRNNTNADNTTIRDITFMTTAAQGTDDRVAIVRGMTQGGDSTTRGGKMIFYTRKANDSGFNGTVLDNAGNLTLVSGAYLALSDTNTKVAHGGGNAVRLQTNSGYIDVGPQNTTWAHIQTDRGKFYFNKQITVDSGIVESYNEDLILRRANNSADQITLGTTGVTFAAGYTLSMSGNITISKEAPVMVINDSDATNNTNQIGYVSFQRQGSETGYVGYGSSSNSNFYVKGGNNVILRSGSTDTVSVNSTTVTVSGAINASGNLTTNGSVLGQGIRASGRGELHLNSNSTTAVSEIFFGYGSGYTAGDGNIRWGISDRGTTDGHLRFYIGPANGNGAFVTHSEMHYDGSFKVGTSGSNGRIEVQKADNNASDHIAFWNGSTRIGEIGAEDNTWLRINQETNKNIYTPRMFRADGGLQSGSGTSAAPSITFQTDQNTGMFRYASDVIGLTAGGTRRMRIGSTVYVDTTDFRIQEYMYHEGDTDTYLRFETNRIRMVAGNQTHFDSNYVKLDTYSQGTVPIAVGRITIKGGGKTGWASGDEFGSIDFYNSDGSGVGARNAVRIVAENNQGNGSSTTTFHGELAFYTSPYNAQLNSNPALRLEHDNDARFYGTLKAPNASATAPAYSFDDDPDSGMFRYSANYIGFTAGGTRRMRIGSAIYLDVGNVQIQNYLYHMGDTNTYMKYDADRIRFVAGGVEMLDMVEGGTDYIDIVDRVRVTAGGNLECEGNLIAYSTTSISDINQKENIQRIESPIEKIKQISGYTFDWKTSGEQSGGVIAQEVEQVMPSVVKETSIRDGDKIKAVDYQAIIGLLVETVKDLNKRIEELENGNNEDDQP